MSHRTKGYSVPCDVVAEEERQVGGQTPHDLVDRDLAGILEPHLL